ncbi:hypothetical protein [Qipengyuania vesicularis]|uniref:hypothetical protein n=1 Tax=Qipengyuania vesicularis TaxID=2867232 RepID=UPI001C86DB38|nr:hypothetical protein [Qipengyuania vesicularis]MBX7527661.1 hypothetical protein [Qipengyuania vesicularis]
MKYSTKFAGALAFMLSTSLGAQSLETQDGVNADPHVALVDAMMSPEGLAVASTNSIAEIRKVYEADADLIEMEAECPGTIDLLMATTTPFFYEYDRIEAELRREAMVEILRVEMSEEHARAASEFYSSEIGQKLTMAVMDNYSIETTLNAAMQSEEDEFEVDPKDVASDNLRSAAAAALTLSPEEKASIESQLRGREWFAALLKARPKMFARGMEIANSDFAPHLDREIETAVDTALTAHLDDCGY